MTNTKKKVGDCTVGCENDVLHLVVLISGTTDPVNSFTDDAHGARSYRQEPRTTYWDTAFYEGVEALVKANRNAKLFDFHGWSGDNRKGNREVAGRYLVNRLVGGNKETAFYGPTYQKKTIHIHLIGHSHGGNVINEMTQQMAALGAKWPATWKVKSFTYLSTPFFQKLHQVKVGSFVHPQAEVLNVFNDYDMTQRMLADFSLFTLHDVIDANDLTNTINNNLEQLMASFRAVPWDLGTDLYLNEEEGRRLYTATRDFLGNVEVRLGFVSVIQFLQSIETIAVGLNKPVEYKVDPGLQTNNTVTQSYQLLSDANLGNLKRVIKALVASINLSIVGLNEGLSANSFSRTGFIAALFRGSVALANNLAAFLNVPAGTPNVGTSGVLWQTLVGVLSDAIEVFDNTVTKPDAQFNGSRTITPLNVTAKDKYHNSPQKANCLKLMTKIEALEKRATAKPDANLLFDLVLILMVHDPKVRGLANDFRSWAAWMNTAENLVTGDLDATLKAVRAMMTNMSNALLSRFEGEIEDPSDTHPDKKIGRRGSLPYLLKESHSTSRRVLRPEVKAFLQRMMG
jgi:hypothetical protein